MTILKLPSSSTTATCLTIISLIGLHFNIPSNEALSQYSKTVQEHTSIQAKQDSLRLTQQKVKYWIQTRIAEAKLQNQMKADAADDDNLIQAFYAERKTLLQQRGWTVTEYEEAQDRIHAAVSAMELAEDQAENRDEHEQQIAEIKANTFFTEDQKQQMIAGLQKVREQERGMYIEPTKPDWPAVRPHRKIINHMTDWIAGNRSDAPVVE